MPDGSSSSLLALISEGLEGSSSVSSGQRGTTHVTQIVHHQTPEPTSQYEYAHRITADVQRLSEPHVLMSVLKSVEKRIMDLRQLKAASSKP